jgi:hypothetical protein
LASKWGKREESGGRKEGLNKVRKEVRKEGRIIKKFGLAQYKCAKLHTWVFSVEASLASAHLCVSHHALSQLRL